MPVLQLKDVSKRYQKGQHTVDALLEASLSVDAGEMVVARGPSGAGKSTLLMVAGGLLRPDSGEVEIDGQSLYGMGPDRRACFRADNIGFVFQQFHLIPYLNVLENVLVSAGAVGTSQVGRAEWIDRAKKILDELNMSDRLDHLPRQLSIGQRQRTALARAILTKPKLLLADEPTGNLDPDAARSVVDQLRGYAAGGGAVLLVTHHDTTGEPSEGAAERYVRIVQGRLEEAQPV